MPAVSSIVSGRAYGDGWPGTLRPVQYTIAPASASARAIPRPAPRVAPATTATCSPSAFIVLYRFSASIFQRSTAVIRWIVCMRRNTTFLPSGVNSAPSSLSGVVVNRRVVPSATRNTPSSLAPPTANPYSTHWPSFDHHNGPWPGSRIGRPPLPSALSIIARNFPSACSTSATTTSPVGEGFTQSTLLRSQTTLLVPSGRNRTSASCPAFAIVAAKNPGWALIVSGGELKLPSFVTRTGSPPAAGIRHTS